MIDATMFPADDVINGLGDWGGLGSGASQSSTDSVGQVGTETLAAGAGIGASKATLYWWVGLFALLVLMHVVSLKLTE